MNLVTAALLLVPALAFADAKQAKPHIDAAMKAHGEGKFDVALHELEAAYKADPDPELLYAIGQVHAKLGNCTEATKHYEKYRASSKDPAVGKAVDEAIAACEPKTTPPVTPPPTTNPPPPMTDPGQPASTTQPFYKDKVGDILVGAGAVCMLTGIVFYASARGDLDDAEAAPNLDKYNDLVDSAHSKRTLSAVFIGGSVALVVGGVIHYKRFAKRSETTVTVTPTTSGGAVTLFGRF